MIDGDEAGPADRSTAGALDGFWRGPRIDGLEVRGADRARFLHGLVTCEVKARGPGDGGYGFFTTGQGRVAADFVLAVLEDRLWLAVPPGSAEGLVAHLGKYVIADRVEARAETAARAITVLGSARERLAAVPGFPWVADAPAWWAQPVAIGGAAMVAQVHARLGVPATTLWLAGAREAAAVEALLGTLGIEAVAEEAMERRRIAAGIGRFGRDFDERHFPQETGAEADAVSYTKGCYLGQEIVARLHYRGQAQNALTLLAAGSESSPALEPGALLGAAVFAEGIECGRLSSVTPADRAGWLGLAMLHRRAEGKELTVRPAAEGAEPVSARRITADRD